MRAWGIVLVGFALAVGCRDQAPRVSQGGQGIVVVTPATTDFGLVETGTAAAPRTFTISPEAGFQEDVVHAVTTCPNFPVVAPNLPAAVFRRCSAFSGVGYGGEGEVTCVAFDEQSYSFTVGFAPTVAGATSCTIEVNLGNTKQTIVVQGTGKLPDFAADVSKAPLDFGDIRRTKTSNAQTVTVRNIGGKDLTISATLDDPAGAFAVTGTLAAHTIAPGGKDELAVTCAPSAIGPVTATLQVLTEDPKNLSVDIPLACTGIDSDMDVAFAGSFPLQTRVGEPVPVEFTLANEGNVVATVTEVVLVDAHPDVTIVAAPAAGSQIAVGESVPVTLSYAAAVPYRGALGKLVVKIESEADRTTPLSAEARLATVKSEPPTLDFPPTCVGSDATRTVDVFAEADGEFLVASVDAPASPFAVTAGEVPGTAAALRANDVRFFVTVAPTQVGEFEQDIVVRTDAPGQAEYRIPAQVRGLPAGASVSPPAIEFRRTIVTGYTEASTVFFTNCTGQQLQVRDVRLAGEHAADFALTKIRPLAAPRLEPSQQMEIDVQMTPRSDGAKTAQLVVEYEGGGTQTVELTGSAFLGPQRLAERETYYACSTGAGPGGLAAVLAALALVVLRRRRR